VRSFGEFRNIAEIRSLAPKNTNLLALTATANQVTQKVIFERLEMDRCFFLRKLPNNRNISYVVLPKPKDLRLVLQPIIDELVCKTIKADKHLVFCKKHMMKHTNFSRSCLSVWEKRMHFTLRILQHLALQNNPSTRDGEHCTAILYWSAKDLSSKDIITNVMKAY